MELMAIAVLRKGEKMPIKGENGGYKYKAFINGEWHDLTLSDSPNELTEWLQSHEEWARVKHGHWTEIDRGLLWQCSECGHHSISGGHYCDWCGAKMEEVSK